MSFLLDTNVCSAALKNDRRLFARFVQHSGQLFTSRIVLAELHAWAYLIDDPSRRLKAIEELLGEVLVLEFDDACCVVYGKLKRSLRGAGVSIAPLDLLIASTALVHGLTLVTHDADFARIPGLPCADWLHP
jgi:tRNA(fMet)-specific endonuclease VapC